MAQPFLTVAVLLAVAAAVSDFRSLRIPNMFPAAIAALFLPAAALHGMPLQLFFGHLAVGAVVLLIGVGLFAARALGGGDGKLLAALALWAGPELAVPFLICTVLFGGGLAFAALAANRIALPVWAYSIDWIAATGKRRSIPYGVAIALAAMTVFWSRLA